MTTVGMSRRRALKGLALLGLGTAGIAALPGCATAPAATTAVEAVATESEAPAATQETVTIRLSSWSQLIGAPDVMDTAILPPFEEMYPNVKVQFEESPWQEFWTKFNASAAAGDVPDVYSQSLAYGWDHANAGVALNMQPWVDTEVNTDDYFWGLDFSALMYPEIGKGDLYAMPFHWNGSPLFYNVDIFDEAGLAYPDGTWTYDDTLQTAKALTIVEGDKTKQWGMVAPAGYQGLDPMIRANGGNVLSDDYRKCMLTEPAAVESAQWCVDLILKDKVAPSKSAQQGFPEGVFPSQAVAMEIANSVRAESWKAATFNFDISFVPKGKVGRVQEGGPDALAIGGTTKHKEEAWDLVSYFISEEAQMEMTVILIGLVPFLKKAAYSDKFLSREGTPAGMKCVLDMAAAEGETQEVNFGPKWEEWHTILDNEMDLAYLGERSVEESLEVACAGIDAVLATIKWPD